MATKPTTLPRWATDAGRILEPSSGEKDAGWQAGYKPPARKMNWLFNLLYRWMQYLEDAVFVAEAGSGYAGLDATGDGVGAGVEGTGGSTGVGVLGTGGASGGAGVKGVASSAGQPGVDGYGNTAGPGVKGLGGTSGAGVDGTGGSTSGPGVKGTAGASGQSGVEGYGNGTGSGTKGIGGANGVGIEGVGGSASGPGVRGTATAAGANGTEGIGNGTGHGLYGEAGTAGGSAVKAISSTGGGPAIYGSAVNNTAIYGTAAGGQIAVHGNNASSGIGVKCESLTGYAAWIETDTTSPNRAPLHIEPQSAAPSGPNQIGDIYVTTAGIPYICTVAGTPGTWTKFSAT